MNRAFWCVVACGSIASFACLACRFETEEDGCEDSGQAADRPFSASITEGQLLDPPSTFPHVVGVRVQSDWLIRGVNVGTVPAILTDPRQFLWKASLSRADLENQRQGTNAVLPVRVTDVCNATHDIDSSPITLPLGPAPGIGVSELALDIVRSPPTECAVPATLATPVAVLVSASAGSAGGTVSLATTGGSFQGGATSLNVRLMDGGDRATAPAVYFIAGSAPGRAIVSAYAPGSEPQVMTVPIVAPPNITAPVTTLRRGTAYEVSVRSAGNLASCSVEPVFQDTATFRVLIPTSLAGEIDGTKSLQLAPVSCAEPERVGLSVSFEDNAPDDAAITLRCLDTLAQEASVTFLVDPDSSVDAGTE